MGGEKTEIIVRDLRNATFRVDDLFADAYAGPLGPYTTAIYLQLCRKANREQEAWPGFRLLAEKAGVSERQVSVSILTLEESQIIGIIRGRSSKGRQAVNVYVLFDRSQWLPPINRKEKRNSRLHHAQSGQTAPGAASRLHQPTAPGAVEGNTRKETQMKEEKNINSNAKSLHDILVETRADLVRKGVLRPKK